MGDHPQQVIETAQHSNGFVDGRQCNYCMPR